MFPFLLAWGLREFFPNAHKQVVAYCRNLAFYLWGFGLILSVGQTCRFLADSPVSANVKWTLSLVSLVACILQFCLGKSIGAAYGERIGSGQGLGQKNTIFAIWVTYTYLTPVLSVAPGTYIIWQTYSTRGNFGANKGLKKRTTDKHINNDGRMLVPFRRRNERRNPVQGASNQKDCRSTR